MVELTQDEIKYLKKFIAKEKEVKYCEGTITEIKGRTKKGHLIFGKTRPMERAK